MSQEKRRHERLHFRGTIFIERVSPSSNGKDGEVIKCETLDISRSGLRVGIDQELRVGTILQIGVEMPDTPETLYLAGEVIWCRSGGDGAGYAWLVGFELMNANGSDIDDWRSLLDQMDAQD